jgi:hypothetical protein
MSKLIRIVPIVLLAAPLVAYAQGTPQNLTSTVNGNTVTLNWSGGSGSVVVEASFTPGGAVIASLPVTGTSLTVPGVPPGTYFVRVRNASGGAASNEVTVTVSGTGCPAPPQPPNLFVRSVGLLATVEWGSSGGCAPTDFTLFAGSGPGLSNIAIVNAGGSLGLQTAAPGGTYYVRVVGTNAFGSAVSQELTFRIFANAQTDTVTPFGVIAFDVLMTQTGTYQAALVWDDPTIDLDLYLTTAGCPYPPGACLLAISDAAGTNTEAVSRSVVTGQTYRLFVDNVTPTGRTTSFTIFSTIGGAPPLSLPSSAEEGSEELRIKKTKPQ